MSQTPAAFEAMPMPPQGPSVLERLRTSAALRMSAIGISVLGTGALAACSGDQASSAPVDSSPTISASTNASESSLSQSPSPSPTEIPLSGLFAAPGAASDHLAPDQLLLSYNEVVRGVGKNEENAGEPLFDGVLHFVNEPASTDDIRPGDDSPTGWHAPGFAQIEEAGFGKSITIVEPGSSVNLDDFVTEAGEPRPSATEYFRFLKEQGVTEQQLGNVALIPEPIAGEWPGFSPAKYAQLVNTQAKALHESFPNANSTLMIDISEAPELIPVLPKIDESQITSIGIQGFANGRQVGFKVVDGKLVANVEAYLNPEVIEDVVNAVGGNLPVWINTGSESKYGPDKRAAIAEGDVRVVDTLQDKGMRVEALDIFGENKTDTKEGRNFSYSADEAQKILVPLRDDLHARRVALYGFDVADRQAA